MIRVEVYTAVRYSRGRIQKFWLGGRGKHPKVKQCPLGCGVSGCVVLWAACDSPVWLVTVLSDLLLPIAYYSNVCCILDKWEHVSYLRWCNSIFFFICEISYLKIFAHRCLCRFIFNPLSTLNTILACWHSKYIQRCKLLVVGFKCDAVTVHV